MKLSKIKFDNISFDKIIKETVEGSCQKIKSEQSNI